MADANDVDMDDVANIPPASSAAMTAHAERNRAVALAMAAGHARMRSAKPQPAVVAAAAAVAVAPPADPRLYLFRSATATEPAEMDQRVQIPDEIQYEIDADRLNLLGIDFTAPIHEWDDPDLQRSLIPSHEFIIYFDASGDDNDKNAENAESGAWIDVYRRSFTQPLGNIHKFSKVMHRVKRECTPDTRFDLVLEMVLAFNGVEHMSLYAHKEDEDGDQDRTPEKALGDFNLRQREFDLDARPYAIRVLASLTQDVVRLWVLASILCKWMETAPVHIDAMDYATSCAKRIKWLLIEMRQLGWDIMEPAAVVAAYKQHPGNKIATRRPVRDWIYVHRDAIHTGILRDAWLSAAATRVQPSVPVQSLFDNRELRLPIHADAACDAARHPTQESIRMSVIPHCNTLDKMRVMRSVLRSRVGANLIDEEHGLRPLVELLRPLSDDKRDRLLLLALCLDTTNMLQRAGGLNWHTRPKSVNRKWTMLDSWVLDEDPEDDNDKVYASMIEIEMQVARLLHPANKLGYHPITFGTIMKITNQPAMRRRFIALDMWPPSDWSPVLRERVNVAWTVATHRVTLPIAVPMALSLARPQRTEAELREIRDMGLPEPAVRINRLPDAINLHIAGFLTGAIPPFPDKPGMRVSRVVVAQFQDIADTLARGAAVSRAKAQAERARDVKAQAERARDEGRGGDDFDTDRHRKPRAARVVAAAAVAPPVAAAAPIQAQDRVEEMDVTSRGRRLRSRVYV